MKTINRRTLLAGTGALTVAAAAGYGLTRGRVSTVALAEGRVRLAMPPLLDTTETGRLDLTALSGETRFFSGAPSRTFGYNQAYLGPTVRMRNGPLAARVQNALDDPVTVHWHGLIVPGEHDGGPHSPIRPGGVWSPDMHLDQAPGTPFYHTHVHGQTASHVYRGLAGVIHMTDGRDDDRGLPTSYGVDDLTLVLQDRRFDEQGRMIYDLSMMDVMHGFTGDTMLVNGQPSPVAAVPRAVVRLRLVNGSNARIYSLFAEDGRPLHLVASDGGYLPEPVAVEVLQLGPGERAEILVDFTGGQPTTLMSRDDPNQGPAGMMGRFGAMLDAVIPGSFPVLPLLVDETLPARIRTVPDRLSDPLPALAQEVVATRRFSLDMGMRGMMGGMMRRGGMMGGFAINGRPFDMNRIDLEVKRDTVERWVVSSPMLSHPFHVHGAVFR
ncbi:MAG: multicopper oxidase domain-containing protein, partial [Zhengella sp.]|uniref:multicopper oxidase family protein n=1 Tax=Zhengella sp. TaxID=2282762 RepID=UPI003528EF09